ncbi:hypothetical protein Tco_1394740 [Tanacetum coccineum]
MDADALLAARLQEEEREQFSIDEQARFLVETIAERKRFTYNQLKNKSLEEIQKLYERERKWINDFVLMDSKMVKDSGKKDEDSQNQVESSKKRPRAEHDEETDGSFKNYKIFSETLDDFNRKDMVDLYTLVKERYETIILEGYDKLLWGDLITLFESSKEDKIWKGQRDYKLISWRLFDSCGVHLLLMDTGIAIHMMVEKKYPLTQEMLSRMLNRRLEVDHESNMAFELIRFIKAQLEE